MRVREDGYVRRLVKRVFDPTQNQSAVGISHVENHETHSMTALATQGTGKQIWPVAELLCCFLNTALCGGGNVACQRSIVQDDRNCGRRKTTGARDVAN